MSAILQWLPRRRGARVVAAAAAALLLVGLASVALQEETVAPLVYEHTVAERKKLVGKRATAAELERVLGLTGDAAKTCLASPYLADWTTDDFRRAHASAAAYRDSRERRRAVFDAVPYAAKFNSEPDYFPAAQLARHGAPQDGGKWLSSLGSLAAPCTIYSLGSFGEFSFEEAMSAATPCDIFSFDCTVAPERLPPLPPRVTFDPTCLGDATPDGTFAPLDALMAKHGHASLSVLKIDIEGAEYPVVASLAAVVAAKGWAGSFAVLPTQVTVEAHLIKLPPAVARTPLFELFDGLNQNLLDMGYVLVSRESNPLCDTCQEFTWLRLPAACWRAPPADAAGATAGKA